MCFTNNQLNPTMSSHFGVKYIDPKPCSELAQKAGIQPVLKILKIAGQMWKPNKSSPIFALKYKEMFETTTYLHFPDILSPFARNDSPKIRNRHLSYREWWYPWDGGCLIVGFYWVYPLLIGLHQGEFKQLGPLQWDVGHLAFVACGIARRAAPLTACGTSSFWCEKVWHRKTSWKEDIWPNYCISPTEVSLK